MVGGETTFVVFGQIFILLVNIKVHNMLKNQAILSVFYFLITLKQPESLGTESPHKPSHIFAILKPKYTSK